MARSFLPKLHNYQLYSKIQYNGAASLVNEGFIRAHIAAIVLGAEFQGCFTVKYKSQGCSFGISHFHTL
jgi:hypothetical protein